MECCCMSSAAEHRRTMPSESEAILNALPNPVLLIAPDGRIMDANMAAESFFEISTQFLRRQSLKELVPFGSPLLALIDQVRSSGSPVNEYKVDLGTPRIGGDRQVEDRKSTRLNSSHANISYAVFCLKKKKKTPTLLHFKKKKKKKKNKQ